jgi:hypothetical protein
MQIDRAARRADGVHANRKDVLHQLVELAVAGKLSGGVLNRADQPLIGIHLYT